MTTINISELDKAEVLAALFNASRQQGMGFMHAEGRGSMSAAEAREILSNGCYFDYLRGRVMKVTIENDMYVGLYDRDNGQGAAERAIAPLRAKVASKLTETKSRRFEDDAPLTPQAAWPFPTASSPIEREPAPEPERAYASGGGGDFGGGGASSSWSDSNSSSDSSSSSSSDSGSCSSSSSD